MQHFQWLIVLKPHLHSILSSKSKTRIVLFSVKCSISYSNDHYYFVQPFYISRIK